MDRTHLEIAELRQHVHALDMELKALSARVEALTVRLAKLEARGLPPGAGRAAKPITDRPPATIKPKKEATDKAT